MNTETTLKPKSHHKRYIGDLRIQLDWRGTVPLCGITIVSSEQAKTIRESRMGANSFSAPLSRSDLSALRSQIDTIIANIDEVYPPDESE